MNAATTPTPATSAPATPTTPATAALNSPEQAEAPLRVTLLGDSTVATMPAGRGIHGWGEFLADLFPGAQVANLASSGASTKSFLELPQYQEALALPATHWLIQFGHNDMKDFDPKRFTTPQGSYRDNLLAMANAARSKGAVPVLVTSPHRVLFDEAGTPTQELLPYVDAVRALAADEGIALIDLYALSGALLGALGQAGSAWVTATERQDFAHFTIFGARVIASFVGSQLAQIISAGAASALGAAEADGATIATGTPAADYQRADYQRAEDCNVR